LLEYIHILLVNLTLHNAIAAFFSTSQGFQDDMQSTLQILDRAHTQFVSDSGSPPDPLQPHLFDNRTVHTYNIFRVLSERQEYSQLVSELVIRLIDL
jgi:hypothetical protein